MLWSMSSKDSNDLAGLVPPEANPKVPEIIAEVPAVHEDEVLQAEAAEIAAERATRKMPGDAGAPPVGLALSGGGIRSATFALGALQTLCRLELPVRGLKRPLIDFIDYLSTVSGGGYIGSWFVANRRREMAQQQKAGTAFAMTPAEGCAECDKATEQVAHLRRYSHYLSPEAGLMSADTWTMVTIWLRNTLLIQAMVFCVVAVCFMLPHLWLRVVNGLPWLLDETHGADAPVLAAGLSVPFRGLEGLFPLAILGCFFIAYRQARKEIALFLEDRQVDSGRVKAETINPIDQKRVQVRIVLPAVAAALLTTLWLWLHHFRLQYQTDLINQAKAMPAIVPMPGYFNSWMTGMQDYVKDIDTKEILKTATLADWWDGRETTTILASPWMIVLTLLVVLMAHRLMWLKEDLAAARRPSSHGRKLLVWLGQTLRRIWDPGRFPAAAPFWRSCIQDLWHSRQMHRRVLFYASLVSGSLFSLYLIDETIRTIHQTQISFSNTQPAMSLSVDTLNGHLEAGFTPAAPTRSFEIGIGLAATLGPAMMVLKYMFILILAMGLAGRRMFDNVREWWSRVGAWLMIYSLAMLVVCGIVLFSPIIFDWIGDRMSTWAQGGVITGWLATMVTTLLLGKSDKSSGSNERKLPLLNLDNAALVVFIGLLFGAAWLVRFMLTPEGFSPQANDPLLLGTLDGRFGGWDRFWLVFGGLFCVGAALVWRIDLNEFSMNHFYRNRLVRCYLGAATHLKDDRRPHPFTGFEFRDDQALAGFTAERGHPGPYPLINTALNTSQGGDLEVQERKAESFVLSPLYCGSQRRRLTLPEKEKKQVSEGFRRTSGFMSGKTDEQADRDADSDAMRLSERGMKLGTAFSVSGAAASPNSGYHTSPVLAFLMTIFNVRLGWWVPNPAKKDWMRQAPKFPGFLKYLCFELFGSATPSSAFIYLSDGGHFENLGIYELVRRRCRFIIAMDGEEDGEFTFHALGTAIRRCRVDFDVEIEISVDELRPDPATGFSRSHCAAGIIRYPDGQRGTLLYIKTSLTGDEATDIAQYKALNPAFPHESTGDQFFSESQFESYRKLGQHAAWEALAPLRRTAMPEGELADPTARLRDELQQHWFRAAKAPKEAFINHTARLDEIWAAIAEDDLPACISDIVLPRQPGAAYLDMPKEEEQRQQVMCFGQRLIQLMENVCLDLQLSTASNHPDHTGWVELFRAWATHPVLNAIWESSKATYGTRFAHFWEDLRGTKDS